MRQEIKPQLWPSWYYGPDGEAEIFNNASEVPPGWTTDPYRKPGEPPKPGEKLDGDALKKALKKKGMKIDPRWSDAHMKKLLEEMETE